VAEDGEVKLKLEQGAEVSLRDIHSISTAQPQA
jgi:hypothetical protein